MFFYLDRTPEEGWRIDYLKYFYEKTKQNKNDCDQYFEY